MFEKLRQMFSSPEDKSWFAAHKLVFIKLGFVFLISYLAASATNSIVLPKIMQVFSAPSPVTKASEGASESISSKNQLNYHEIKKSVLDRNVFNQTGEVPKEEEERADKGKGVFDMDAPCESTTLKVKLIGMIALEGRGSIATIKEDNFEGSDVYSEGDFIIGSESAQIVKIERNSVIINNAGRKECLDLKLGDEKLSKATAPMGGGNFVSEETVVDLDSSYVLSELGEGFGKIIQSARLVPNTVNNQVNGFKVFGIQSGTVLDKAGFKENDVVTKVNNIVMEAEQGFALYQALKDEKQIRVTVLRNGTTPKTIVIRVK